MSKFLVAWTLALLLSAPAGVCEAVGVGNTVGVGNASGFGDAVSFVGVVDKSGVSNAYENRMRGVVNTQRVVAESMSVTDSKIPATMGTYGIKAAFRAMNMPFSLLLFSNAMEDGCDLFFGDMKSFSFKTPLPVHIATQIRQAPSFKKAEAEVLATASLNGGAYACKSFKNIMINEKNDAYYSLRGFYYGVIIEAILVDTKIFDNEYAYQKFLWSEDIDTLQIQRRNEEAGRLFGMNASVDHLNIESDKVERSYDKSDNVERIYDKNGSGLPTYDESASFELYRVQVVARDRYDFHNNFDNDFCDEKTPFSGFVRNGLQFALWQQEIGALKNFDIFIGFNYYVVK